MGRHTFESLPAGPLPRRKNVVLSSRPELLPSTVSAFSSLSEALAEERGEDELFIIGGATLYNQSIADAGRLYITEIHHDFPVWKEIGREDFPADDRHAYAYSFVVYERF